MHLQSRGLTKTFGTLTAVDHVDVDFTPGRIHAVLGENGAGKSTLMKLLFGLHQPTSGSVMIDGKDVRWRSPMDAISHGLGMVQQHFALVDTHSAIDNIILGAEPVRRGRVDRAGAIERMSKILPTPSLAVPWHVPVSKLTVGQKQKVEILKLLYRDARVLFLDEPTAVLSPSEIDDFFALLKLLAQQGRSIVLITHKISEVFRVCETYTVLRHGQVTARGELKGLDPAALVEAMVGRQMQPLSEVRRPSQNKVVLGCSHIDSETASSNEFLSDVSFEIRAGEIFGVAGIEGSGQAALVDCILGLRPYRGSIAFKGLDLGGLSPMTIRAHALAVIPEDRLSQGLWPQADLVANCMLGVEEQFAQAGRIRMGGARPRIARWLETYDVRTASLDNAAGSLSGGNQQKLIFARELEARNPELLICHQPTRGVDLGAIEKLHRMILKKRDGGLAVLLISSELDELMALSDRVGVFYNGQLGQVFERSDFDRQKIGACMTGVFS